MLGAGFSAPAGVPLAAELWREVRDAVYRQYGADNWVERDLARFVQYRRLTAGEDVTAETVNLEEFLGFLDTEHYLGLKGKDNWSDEGNESQLMIRNAIAQVLYQRTPVERGDIPEVYLRFAERLTTTDWVLTFNYDLLLEAALRAVGRPFRRFPHRYSEVGRFSNTIDDEKDELVLLKMHGSIDWFDRSSYARSAADAEALGEPLSRRHAVFGRENVVDPVPLVDGLRADDDPLASIYTVPDIGPLLTQAFWKWSPLILAPSTAKLFGGHALRELWWGAQRSGGMNLGFGVVGYSLPVHDEYARQMLFYMSRNYTGFEPDLEFAGRKKEPLRVLDMRSSPEAAQQLRSTYRFLDPERSDVWLDGLTDKAVDWLFSPRTG